VIIIIFFNIGAPFYSMSIEPGVLCASVWPETVFAGSFCLSVSSNNTSFLRFLTARVNLAFVGLEQQSSEITHKHVNSAVVPVNVEISGCGIKNLSHKILKISACVQQVAVAQKIEVPRQQVCQPSEGFCSEPLNSADLFSMAFKRQQQLSAQIIVFLIMLIFQIKSYFDFFSRSFCSFMCAIAISFSMRVVFFCSSMQLEYPTPARPHTQVVSAICQPSGAIADG